MKQRKVSEKEEVEVQSKLFGDPTSFLGQIHHLADVGSSFARFGHFK